MDFLRVLFRIQFRACAVSSEVLQGCSTRRTLSSARASILQLADMSSPCALLCRVLILYDEVPSFFHDFDLIAESDPQTIAPTFF